MSQHEFKSPQTFEIHLSFSGKLYPFYLLASLILTSSIRIWAPHVLRHGTLWIANLIIILLTFSTFCQWKRNLSIIFGKPAFKIASDGIWAEINKSLYPWNQVMSVHKYEEPDVLVIDLPFSKESSAIVRKLPLIFSKKYHRLYFTPKRMAEPMVQVLEQISKYVRIQYSIGAPGEIIEELRRLI